MERRPRARRALARTAIALALGASACSAGASADADPEVDDARDDAVDDSNGEVGATGDDGLATPTAAGDASGQPPIDQVSSGIAAGLDDAHAPGAPDADTDTAVTDDELDAATDPDADGEDTDREETGDHGADESTAATGDDVEETPLGPSPQETDPTAGASGADAVALIDLRTSSIANATFGDPVDLDERKPGTLVGDVIGALGPPTLVTGWRPMPPHLACTGSDEYRAALWGDLRLVVERDESGDDGFLGSWTLGDARAIGPVEPSVDPTVTPSGTTTLERVGLGDPVIDITRVDLLDTGDGSFVLPTSALVTIDVDDRGLVTGMASGRTDCIGLDTSDIPCGRPLPIAVMPGGEPTAGVVVENSRATWTAESPDATTDPTTHSTIDPATGPTGDTVTEILAEPDVGVVAEALPSPIRAAAGPMIVLAVALDDGPGAWRFVQVDSRSDCHRWFVVDASLDAAAAQRYAAALIDTWYPRL